MSAFNYSWIINGLAQGTFPGTPETAFKDFDVVVLCAEEHQPRWRVPPGKKLYHLPLDDDGYNQVPLDVGRIVIQAAHAAGTHHVAGHPVVTTCHQGRNRSGIVTALILMLHYNMQPREAIRLVQSRRKNDALANPMFTQFLYNVPAYIQGR